jgi:hypothetical protein
MLIPIASHTASHVFAGDVQQPPDGGEDTSLEDLGRDEREYVRGRLRAELGREPTDEEIDEWLREHTEGY